MGKTKNKVYSLGRSKAYMQRLKFFAQFLIVINFPVVYDRVAVVFGEHGLVRVVGKDHNGQSVETERGMRSISPIAITTGAAARHKGNNAVHQPVCLHAFSFISED